MFSATVFTVTHPSKSDVFNHVFENCRQFQGQPHQKTINKCWSTGLGVSWILTEPNYTEDHWPILKAILKYTLFSMQIGFWGHCNFIHFFLCTWLCVVFCSAGMVLKNMFFILSAQTTPSLIDQDFVNKEEGGSSGVVC